MFQKLVPVNLTRHAKTKIKQVDGFGFAGGFHIASVMMHEFARAAAIYPIVFIEDKQLDEFRPVVLLGLDANENLFVDKDGKWQSSYIPAIIRRYPFALARTDKEGQFTVCIDEGSALVSEEEGNALFDDQGAATQVVENVKRYLGELQQMEVVTQAFCKFLTEHNMFTPLNMRVRDKDQVKNITGCYVINEERLNNLSDDKFKEMRELRYLPAIYAQLISLAQIDRLVMLKDERTTVPAGKKDGKKAKAAD
jgi:hypothetical protein